MNNFSQFLSVCGPLVNVVSCIVDFNPITVQQHVSQLTLDKTTLEKWTDSSLQGESRSYKLCDYRLDHILKVEKGLALQMAP